MLHSIAIARANERIYSRPKKGQFAASPDGLTYPPGTGPIQTHNGLPGHRG